MREQHIEVLCCDVKVITENPEIWATNGLGRSALSSSTIRLREGMPQDVRGTVFFHELIHFMADLLSIKLSEQTVDGLALGMYSLYKNNDVQEILGEEGESKND